MSDDIERKYLFAKAFLIQCFIQMRLFLRVYLGERIWL